MDAKERLKTAVKPKLDPRQQTKMVLFKTPASRKMQLKIATKKLGLNSSSELIRIITNQWLDEFWADG